MDARRHVSDEGNIQRQSSHSQHHPESSYQQQSAAPPHNEIYRYIHPSLPSIASDGFLIPSDDLPISPRTTNFQHPIAEQSSNATFWGAQSVGGSHIVAHWNTQGNDDQNIDPRLLSNNGHQPEQPYDNMPDWLVDELNNINAVGQTAPRVDGVVALADVPTQLAPRSTADPDRSLTADEFDLRSTHGPTSGSHVQANPDHPHMPPPASIQDIEGWPSYLDHFDSSNRFHSSPIAGPSRLPPRRRRISEDSFAEPTAQRTKKECVGCSKAFYQSKDPEGKRCTRCHTKHVKNSSGPTVYDFDENIDICRSWNRLYPQMPPLNLIGDDVQHEAANEQDYVRRLIEAVNQPYVSDGSRSKEDIQRLAQQAKLNKKPHDSDQYRPDLVNMRLRLLFAIARSYHAGGNSFYGTCIPLSAAIRTQKADDMHRYRRRQLRLRRGPHPSLLRTARKAHPTPGPRQRHRHGHDRRPRCYCFGEEPGEVPAP